MADGGCGALERENRLSRVQRLKPNLKDRD